MLNHQGEFLGGGGRREIGKKKKKEDLGSE